MNFSQIKEYILDQGSDCLNTFGGKFQGGIYLQQHPDEISEILSFIIENKYSSNLMLEVGSAAGANAKVFCEILKVKELFIIDNNMHPRHVLRSANLSNINYKEYVGDSQSKQASEWLSSFNKKFDIIYIDADHSYDGAKRDIENYLPFLQDGGLMVFHDSLCCKGVEKVIEEYKQSKLKELFSSKKKLGITICSKI